MQQQQLGGVFGFFFRLISCSPETSARQWGEKIEMCGRNEDMASGELIIVVE